MTARHSGEDGYVIGERAFLAGASPGSVVETPLSRIFEILRRRFGEAIDEAVSAAAVDLGTALGDLPEAVQSPRAGSVDASWMRQSNMVGINVRTVGDYGGVVKYALTLPAAVDSIHLLPIWEPGVVGSLYGMASWNLNHEFFSDEWFELMPHLDAVEKQLRAVSNVLHLMGKTVGMDVIPHADRFSEIALGNPDLFEWMRVEGRQIVDHSDDLAVQVEDAVFGWLASRRSADSATEVPSDARELFAIAENERLRLLFGDPADLYGRIARRVDLVSHLKGHGLEPVPATMGVPFRGIEVDPDPTRTIVDDQGLEWPDYVISRPEMVSRVFTPLARYKLYGRVDDNANWEIDFSAPRPHVWEYVCRHYAQTRRFGNFDFMRGDMSHVQMRPTGVPETVDAHYDILAAVKTHIQATAQAPWFGYFAETFLPARDVFQFGEELDHLEASLADATLGDLQSTVVGTPEFLRRFRRYLDDLATRRCAPSFTIGTADKDDPRFDEFYRMGGELRFFTALLVPDMPSYVGLGFEIRDEHDEPAENEHYTKLFVFKEKGESNVYPSRARRSDEYVWGQNAALFDSVTAIRTYADQVLPIVGNTGTRWLIPPDATGLRRTAAWTQVTEGDGAPTHVFLANYDVEADSGYFGVPGLPADVVLELDFTTSGSVVRDDHEVRSNGFFHRVENLAPGEGRAYRVAPAQ